MSISAQDNTIVSAELEPLGGHKTSLQHKILASSAGILWVPSDQFLVLLNLQNVRAQPTDLYKRMDH